MKRGYQSKTWPSNMKKSKFARYGTAFKNIERSYTCCDGLAGVGLDGPYLDEYSKKLQS